MESYEKKTITNLTTDSVSILTQQFTEVDGEETQVGSNHRCAYENSESGRALLAEMEPAEVVTAVMAVWGETPTIELPEYVPDNDSESSISVDEFWDEMAVAIEEGVNEV